MAQHSINISCIADTYIDKNNPNTNYGGATALKLGGWQSDYPMFDYCGLIKFDFSSVPSGKNIVGAVLHIYSKSTLADGGYFIYDVLSQTFDEYVATYNNVNGYGGLQSILNGITANTWLTKTISSTYINDSLKRSRLINNGMLMKWNHTDHPGVYLEIDSKEGTNDPYLEVIYEDVPPSKPVIDEPIGVNKSNSSIITFTWDYISSVGGIQKAFDLQWSTDQETWTTISQTTSNEYYDMPADTLPGGNIYWRVQTYNIYDEASGYSDIGAFYSIGAPDTPIIQSVSNVARPTITWSAANQQVFQIQILQGEDIIHDSELLPGVSTREYKVPIYMNDGAYIAKVIIKNEYDLFSEWAEAEFTLSIVRPDKPTIVAEPVQYGIRITASNIEDIDSVLIYRSETEKNDYICIGAAIDGIFTDYSTASDVEYDYFARAIVEEAFTDSDIVTESVTLYNNIFAPVSNLGDIIELKYGLNNIPTKSGTKSMLASKAFYAGRKHPVTRFSEHIEDTMSFSLYVKTFAEIVAFKALINKAETILFRDSKGRKIFATIEVISESDTSSGFIINFSLSEIDYIEEVET